MNWLWWLFTDCCLSGHFQPLFLIGTFVSSERVKKKNLLFCVCMRVCMCVCHRRSLLQHKLKKYFYPKKPVGVLLSRGESTGQCVTKRGHSRFAMFTPQLSKRRDGERVLLETGAEKNNAHVFVLSTTSMCVSASLFIHHLQSLYSMISFSLFSCIRYVLFYLLDLGLVLVLLTFCRCFGGNER